MAAELLRLLVPVVGVRQQVRDLEGLPVLLGLLHSQHLRLLWSSAWILVQLCQDQDTRAEGTYVSDRSSVETLSSTNAAGCLQGQHCSEELSPQELEDNTLALQSAKAPSLQCYAFRMLRFVFSVERNRSLFRRLFPTELFEIFIDVGHYVRDLTAYQALQDMVSLYTTLSSTNAAGCLQGQHCSEELSPQELEDNTLALQSAKAPSLQCYAFRMLRFVFSVERNRSLFRRLFPTELFEIFIDVGHYVRDLTAYQALQDTVSLYTEEELQALREGIESTNQNLPPIRVISGYAVLDHLGTGAFGSVFKVRKQCGQNLLALKEVNLHNPAFGKDKRTRDSNVEKIVSELIIIREQMVHPNIVKYYKTFVEGDRLYVVMELIEGVTLAEHFSALKEKHQKLTEQRVWNIFVQICLALRYLHKEKHIVHRDLTPNNIMLGERDKVTIKIVKSEPYGEKADIWALGCILYQMTTLKTPFYSTNMLSLATKIVEAVYEPVDHTLFSERVSGMIKWCLSPDPDQRPDVVQVSASISDIMMSLMDSFYASHHALQRRADRDRKRAQKPKRRRLLLQPAAWTSSNGTVAKGLAEPLSHLTPLGMASAGISISQRRLRELDDPIQRFLVLLHKIIYITQLPPGPHSSRRSGRRLVERFKKSLFHQDSSALSLKVTLSKVLQGSSEPMELGSASSDWWPQSLSVKAPPYGPRSKDGTDAGTLWDGLSYAQMQAVV
ncbi:hypothetical protein CRUP_028469 [Coryphaenoides rupestris]|nr:hypothetical protein CRUP_028469 [Coryphaenoides rupestris]